MLSIYNTLGNGRLEKSALNTPLKVEYVDYATDSMAPVVNLDFTKAAAYVAPLVVHIKSKMEVTQETWNRTIPEPFRDFFDDEIRKRFFGQPENSIREASGSGVVVSSEGHIVTNNHVVQNATEVEVILNERTSYSAEVIGTDPSTDLALLKIDQDRLEYITFGNSDEVKVGEWVLAVGNPFNLASTVTAGIVSAKARNINILKDRYAIESFIQTDAAVNPGNSGGALINTAGQLIGINTAIATPTGAYAGYSFAIPSNIVRKVVDDLLQYGIVQRGYLGITIRDLDGDLAKSLKLKSPKGVYIDSVANKSAAAIAGIKREDVIVKIDGERTDKASELQAIIATYKPGDKVKVTLYRKGEEKTVQATLKNIEGEEKIVKNKEIEILKVLGADFEDLSGSEKEKLNIGHGVRLKTIYQKGKIHDMRSIKEGFIITHVDKQPVKSVRSLINMLQNMEGGVLLSGIYPGSDTMYYYALAL